MGETNLNQKLYMLVTGKLKNNLSVTTTSGQSRGDHFDSLTYTGVDALSFPMGKIKFR